MLTYRGGSLCRTVVFDLVFSPFPLEISLDPTPVVREYQVCLCGLEGQQKTVNVPRVKVVISLFAPTSSTMTSGYPGCATLPGGNGLGRPVGITTSSYSPGLVWTGAREKGQVQWSVGETQWARLSWPPPDFCGHPLKGTWVLWTQKEAAFLATLLRGHLGSIVDWTVPLPNAWGEPVPQTVTLSGDDVENVIS